MTSEWESVTVLRKKIQPTANTEQAINKARRQGAEVETFAKSNAFNKHTVPPPNAAKLDRDTENLKHSKIPLDLAKLISQMRLSKGMSQKDLATKICEKVQVINDYEAGRAIPNNTILNKIERALGVKLHGKDRGQPIPARPDKSNKK